MTKVHGWIFATLHFLGSLALIILLSLLTGCLRDASLDTDKKDEVSAAKIVDEILRHAPTPDTLNAGDKAWTAHYARTFTNPFTVIEQNTYEVTKKQYAEENTDDGPVKYNLYDIKHINADPNGNIIQIREGQCRLILDPLLGWYPECAIMLPPFQDQFYVLSAGERSSTMGFMSPLSYRSSNVQPMATKFYNLKSKFGKLSLPPKMISAGKCFDFSNCEVPGQIIEFDLQGENNAGLSSRQHYTLTVSNGLPYMASNLETCVSYQTLVDGNPALVDECFRVLDFDVAQNPGAL